MYKGPRVAKWCVNSRRCLTCQHPSLLLGRDPIFWEIFFPQNETCGMTKSCHVVTPRVGIGLNPGQSWRLSPREVTADWDGSAGDIQSLSPRF